MYSLKKFIGFLLSPEIIIIFLLSYGLLKQVLSNRSKIIGWRWIFSGVICFYLFSTTPLPNLLLYHLENQHKPLVDWESAKEIKYIAVLSGSARCNFSVPPTSQLDDSTLLRVVEGIRLFQVFSSQPILIMSGGGQLDTAARMVAFARCLGVPAEKLITEINAEDTHGNAREVKAIVNEAPFLLVTSASHMPRALSIFQNLGMQPYPAPADFRFCEKYTFSDFIPSAHNLTIMKSVIHEYLGLAYLKLFPGRAGK